MKNLARLSLLVAALLMFGCGGGGTTTTTTSSNTGGAPGGGSTPSGATSSFTLTIVDGGTSTAKAQLVTPRILSAPVPAANSARIIFRNISTTTVQVPLYDDNGDPISGQFTTVTQQTEIYKRVVDTSYSAGGTVMVSVPPSPARGYIVDVLTYFDDGLQHYNMLKYGRSAANIVITAAGGSGSVTVNSITPTITATPTPLYSESKYTVTVAGGMPLRNYYNIRQDLSDVSFASFASYSSHVPPGSYGSRTFTAPTTYASGSLYMPAQLFIDDSMLGGAKNESYLRWSMIAPTSFDIIGLVNVSFTP